MIKIILVEDRTIRQKKLINNNLEYDFLTNICGDTAFENFIIDLEKDINILKEYDAILIHRSSLNSTTRQSLIDYCHTTKKSLCFFSGGITSTSYSEKIGFPFLNINARILYNENLLEFLESAKVGKVNLMILGFGNKWEMNILLNYAQRIPALLQNKDLRPGVPKAIFDNTLDSVGINSTINFDIFQSIKNDNSIENPIGILQGLLNEIILKVRTKLIPNDAFDN